MEEHQGALWCCVWKDGRREAKMPIGIMIDIAAVVTGGVLGTFAREKISEYFKERLNMVFGACAMTIGVSSIAHMENLSPVIFAVILGTVFGLLIHLGDKINRVAGKLEYLIGKCKKSGNGKASEKEFRDTLITALVLFCVSGPGIYGSLVSGMSGDHSILIAKSILDLFTALIFACILGMMMAIAVPQFVIFFLLFLLAGIIYPHTTPAMINDFKACGGVITLAAGFRIIKVKMFPVVDMIPAMVLVMPFSLLWTSYVMPLIG